MAAERLEGGSPAPEEVFKSTVEIFRPRAVEHFLSTLRDKRTAPPEFRRSADIIAFLLSIGLAEELPMIVRKIETPVAETSARFIDSSRVLLVGVLRSGYPLCRGIKMSMPEATLALVGIKRDERTAKPQLYYDGLPDSFTGFDKVIIPDPMLATGGSASMVIEMLKKRGASNIHLVSLVSAPEGITRITKDHPEVSITTCAVDAGLDVRKYIVPGLGDFGDRYFGNGRVAIPDVHKGQLLVFQNSEFVTRSLPLAGRQAQIFPTETCNLTCDGCPYPDQSPERKLTLKENELDPEEWFGIIDFLYEQGNQFFCIMGGEPASYQGIDRVIAHITKKPDAFALLSTSGIHLLHHDNLREAVGNALAQPRGRKFKNGIAISFDIIPSSDVVTVRESRELKAKQGLNFVRLMRQEYGDQITYIANVMVTPDNLVQILEIQHFLEQSGIFTNLCTEQVKCFGATDAVFDSSHLPELTRIASEMIGRKIKGGAVVNSAAYLSQLPRIIGREDYHCWEELQGNPVIDVGPDGKIRYCNWIGQDLEMGPPGLNARDLMDESISWDEFWRKSKATTRMLCRGCSWSRRDRNVMTMVEPNKIVSLSFFDFDHRDPKLQNIWVQAQQSCW